MHTAGGHIFDNGNKRLGVLAVDQFLLFNGVYLFLQPEEMKVLAERAADRTTLGISYDEMSAEVSTAFRNSALFRTFRTLDPKLYRLLLNARKSIETHPLMQPGAIPEQAALRGR